ncbi:hypothetical protein [Candidatus Vampirococcus lugosii]|uniref:DNA methylase adenine-specific domain-containing protein n=1 Tax=Candidatus Vampirococcus lugosii TaxID=2789015 RepID=A0ABS5QL43_9BACT|nr:hypothetical protein [Candidatus Vampirococcus lugosii]MBS8121916.1 hypothetical protein [Candidatus Vampirococcus lugosii]
MSDTLEKKEEIVAPEYNINDFLDRNKDIIYSDFGIEAENLEAKKITEDEYIIYNNINESPILILNPDLKEMLFVNIGSDIDKRRYKYSALILGYDIEYNNDGSFSLYNNEFKEKEGENNTIKSKKTGEIDVFSEEFIKAWDKMYFVKIRGHVDSEVDFSYDDFDVFNNIGMLRPRDVIRYKDIIPEDEYKNQMKLAVDNLIDNITDIRYSYLEDEVTIEELDVYLNGGTLVYPEWSSGGYEVEIPKGIISQELYDLGVDIIKELEKMNEEKNEIKEDIQARLDDLI